MRPAAAVTLLLALAAAGVAQARDSDPVAVGRYHLRKANQLAGEDHCHSAIHEYTLAYEKLRDPFVLFNRAECYRRIGQAEKAISDYRAFLERRGLVSRDGPVVDEEGIVLGTHPGYWRFTPGQRRGLGRRGGARRHAAVRRLPATGGHAR